MENLSAFFAFVQLVINALWTALLDKNVFFSRLGLTLLLIASIYSCHDQINSQFGQNNEEVNANTTPIAKIPSVKDHEIPLHIQGQVIQEAPLLHYKVYQISDKTGKIWVVTDRRNWQVGQEVMFNAKVKYSSIILSGKEYGETYLAAE